MATLQNVELTNEWTNVSVTYCTIQVVLGDVYVSVGDEPVSKQGHRLSSRNGEQVIQNNTTGATWVRSTEGFDKAIIAITEF